MFTQPCFIRDNTSCIREKLEEFGYRPFLHNMFSLPYLSTKQDGFYFQTDANRDGALECNTVEAFLAIAALTDDTNMHQWFIWDSKEGQDDNVGKWRLYDDNYNWSWWIFECHKATVEELMEHFNNK